MLIANNLISDEHFAASRRLISMIGERQSTLARDAYSYMHLPMIIGVIFFSLGVKKTLAHTDEVLSMVPAVALCGGLILYLLGQVFLRARYGGTVAWPRIVAALSLGALVGVSGEIEALFLLSAASLVIVLLVAYETVVERSSRQRIRSDETATWI